MFSKGRSAIFALQIILLINCKSLVESTGREIDDFAPHQVQSFSNFDWNFWKVIASNNAGNALVSPLSVKLGLALLYEGADGKTANELAMTLHLPASRLATRDIFSDVLKSLKEPSPDYILNVGTRLYVDSSITSRQRYNAIARTFYETDVKNVNFSDTHLIASDANNWARNLTQGNIDQLIEDQSRLKDSVLLLTSALYFKGTWKNYPFSKDNTIQGNFITPTTKSVKVDYMRADSYFYFYYSQELNAKILRLPYKGNKYSMFIILPDSHDGLDPLIENLNQTLLNQIVWHMERMPVDVRIPKFKFEAGSHLESALQQMGIKEVFTDKAVLTGFAHNENMNNNLQVSDIIHKAGIEVNEEGTSAFAATEIEIGNKNSGMSFIAKHPFMFYIEDESTGTILYMGKVNNPTDGAGGTERATRAPEVPTSNNNNNDIHESNGNSEKIGISLDDRYNYFNLELFQKLMEEHEGNMIVSPASVKAALMTLIEGTDGRTQQEILSALRLPTNLSIIRSVADRDLITLKDTNKSQQLDLATRLWVDKDTQISDDYKNILLKHYGEDVTSVDFKSIPRAVDTINGWVKEKTYNHIESIVNAGNIDPETKVLITSAIYFKYKWKNSFIHASTRDACFNTFDKNCKMVPMMRTIEKFNYANIPALDAQLLEIPYTGNKFSMLIMLPNNHGKDHLSALSRDMLHAPISLLMKSLKPTEIQLQLPKFNIESKLNLKNTLEKVGIKVLFTSNANMTKALPGSQYYVNGVVQNAKIEVNEDGTEAAAVTGLTVVPLMASADIPFNIDRPFLFFIVDKTRGSLLFSGRLVEP